MRINYTDITKQQHTHFHTHTGLVDSLVISTLSLSIHPFTLPVFYPCTPAQKKMLYL